MIEHRRRKHNKRRKSISKIFVEIDRWNRNQIEITLVSYSKNIIYKNYYFEYIPHLHEHLLYRSGTMKEKRRVFREHIDYILNYPRIPANNDDDFDYTPKFNKKRNPAV